MKIVIPDPIRSIPDSDKEKLREMGAIVHTTVPKDQNEIIERIKDAEIITANYIDIDKELIDAAQNLKYIIAPAVGYDWIDVDYAAAKGIKVLNCPTFVPLPVAEFAMALLLSLGKRINDADRDLKKGIWEGMNYQGFELDGKTMGIVGHGNIGKKLQHMAEAFGMKVIYTDSKSTPEELDQLMKDSDVVCLACPLRNNTRGMIDMRRLKMLKKTAYLINVARGAVIDQKALITCLKEKSFAGAGLDVFDGEPPNQGEVSAEIMELVNLPNVIGTPHTAFNTPEAHVRKGAEIMANIQSCLNGTPQNVVN
jgi:D-3-phosphoglycerate dehydrogenase